MANYYVRLNLSIALSERLNTNLLVVFDNSNNDIDFNRIYDELVFEIATNQVFFKKNILLYSTFDYDFNSNSESDENDFDFDKNNFTKPVF